MQNRKYQLLSIASMMVMLILYGLTSLGYLGPMSIGQTSDNIEPLIVPAGFAFAIWGIIYLGLIVFPLYQWFNRFDNYPLWNRVRLWYSINVVLNGLWLVFASYEYLILTVIVIVPMLISLYIINANLNKIEERGQKINFWLERAVFSIYFAWITLATVLNVSAALKFYDWNAFGIDDEFWTIIMIPVAALIAGIVSLKYRNRAYASIVIWAFVALIVKHSEVYPNITYVAGGVVIAFTVIIVWISRKVLSTE